MTPLNLRPENIPPAPGPQGFRQPQWGKEACWGSAFCGQVGGRPTPPPRRGEGHSALCRGLQASRSLPSSPASPEPEMESVAGPNLWCSSLCPSHHLPQDRGRQAAPPGVLKLRRESRHGGLRPWLRGPEDPSALCSRPWQRRRQLGYSGGGGWEPVPCGWWPGLGDALGWEEPGRGDPDCSAAAPAPPKRPACLASAMPLSPSPQPTALV